MQTLEIYKKKAGTLWPRKPISDTDGCILTVQCRPPGRVVHMSCVVVDKSQVLLATQHGQVYLLDLQQNSFRYVMQCPSPPTALSFLKHRPGEFLAALSDCSLHVYNIVSGEQVAVMKGHNAPIQHISIHEREHYALTSSSDTANLWDLDTFERKRRLNVKENVAIVKVFFVGDTLMVTCFADCTIFGWDLESLECKFQLRVPDNSRIKDITHDSTYLIAGGNQVYRYRLNDLTPQVQELSRPGVKQLACIPPSLLVVLGREGAVQLLDVHTHTQLAPPIGPGVKAMSVGRDYLCTVGETGDARVYSIKDMSRNINKPPEPLVRPLQVSSSTNDESSLESRRSKDSQRLKKKENDLKKRTEFTLNPDRLKAILSAYGEFPAKYRLFIWRSLLSLPENYEAFAALSEKQTHTGVVNLHTKYPIKSRKLLRIMHRVLSALSYWSPIFAEVDYLPALSFPFIKVFQNNPLLAFEMIATVLCNWCSQWFTYFPNPPINILGMVENLLAFHDCQLLKHFVECGVTSQVYVWPLLQTLFSEVLTRDEWLQLFDNVLSNPPGWLLAVVVAYCSVNRSALLKCRELDDFQFFFHHRNAVNLKHVIKETYRVLEMVSAPLDPRKLLDDFSPLSSGQYPIFNKYPKYIVDYQIQERERIRQEEETYLAERQTALSMQQETIQRQHEEEGFYRQQKLLLQAEQRRRKLMEEEEEKLKQQRVRLAAMNRELKLKELQMLEATRRRFLAFQQQVKEQDLARLDDQIRRKAEERELETHQAIEGVELRNMELQIQKTLLEQELHRGLYADRQMAGGQKAAETVPNILLKSRIQADERQKVRDTAKHLADWSSIPPPSGLIDIGGAGDAGIGRLEEQSMAGLSDSDRQSRALNESTSTQVSTQFSLDRGREDLDESERQLMSEVRRLRLKLASEKQPPPIRTKQDA